MRKYNAPYRGPISSEMLNIMQLEIIADVSQLTKKVNELENISDVQNGSSDDISVYYGNSVLNTFKKSSLNDVVKDLASITYTEERNNLNRS